MPAAKKQALEMSGSCRKINMGRYHVRGFSPDIIEAGIQTADEINVVPHELVKKRFLKK